MSNHKAHFRGDIQVDGSIVGPDGQPIGGDGGSVDLNHLTELAFGEASDVLLERGSGFYGSLNIVAPGGIIYNDPSVPGVPDQPWTQPSVNIVTDTGFGSYLWLVNDTGHEHLAALYFGIGIEADYRFKMDLDGAMHWGDGILAPNVSLQRVDTSWWGDESGFLQILGSDGLDTGLFVGDITNDAPGVMVTEIGVDALHGSDHRGTLSPYGISVSDTTGSVDSYSNLTANRGLELIVALSDFALRSKINGDVYNHFEILTDGMFRWGDGGAFPDVFLERTAPGVLRLDGNLAFVGMNGISFATDNDASPDVTLTRRSAGLLEIPENGGGLVLHSPDGTAYKLTPPNGGGAATWVAA